MHKCMDKMQMWYFHILLRRGWYSIETKLTTKRIGICGHTSFIRSLLCIVQRKLIYSHWQCLQCIFIYIHACAISEALPCWLEWIYDKRKGISCAAPIANVRMPQMDTNTKNGYKQRHNDKNTTKNPLKWSFYRKKKKQKLWKCLFGFIEWVFGWKSGECSRNRRKKQMIIICCGIYHLAEHSHSPDFKSELNCHASTVTMVTCIEIQKILFPWGWPACLIYRLYRYTSDSAFWSFDISMHLQSHRARY